VNSQLHPQATTFPRDSLVSDWVGPIVGLDIAVKKKIPVSAGN